MSNVSRCDKPKGRRIDASKKRELRDFRFKEIVECSPDGVVKTNVFDANPVML
jgi:ribosomal protein L14